MRVVLFGYHDVGCACLAALFDLGQEIPLLLTHEDDPAETIWFESMRASAERRGVTVIAPDDANAPDVIARVRDAKPDAILSCYYRKILGPELLAIPPRGAYNLHGSLLPKFRGRAPVNWAILKGETVTGVTLHHMTAKPDRGDIVAQRAVPIEPDDTAFTLLKKCATAAGALMREVWPSVEAGTAPRIPQDDAAATTFGRRRPDDGLIDWSRSAHEIHNLVRAVTHPYPGAFTFHAGRKLFIWKTRVAEATEGARPGPAPPGTVVRASADGPIVVAASPGLLVIEEASFAPAPGVGASAPAPGLGASAPAPGLGPCEGLFGSLP